jgi:hypothetical protein
MCPLSIGHSTRLTEAIGSLDHAYLTESTDLVAAYVTGYVRAINPAMETSHIASAVETAFTRVGRQRSRRRSKRSARWSLPTTGLCSSRNSLGHVEEGLTGICQVGAGPGAVADAMIDSFHVGVEKPDPRIFELALETVGGLPEASVHVGDSVVYDVAGAAAAGIRAVHFDPWLSCATTDHGHVTSLVGVVASLS